MKSHDQHKLGIIVPYSSENEQYLSIFIEYMVNWLKCFRNFRIYVVEQVNNLPYNRGAVINIGFLAGIEDDCDFFVIQEVNMVHI